MTAFVLDRARPMAIDTLVDRAAGGEHAAFDRLTELFVDDAFRTAQAILRSEADARDAVQDAFVAAWRELPRLRDRGQFGPWLTRILVNRCRSGLRHRRVVSVRELALEPPPDSAGSKASAAFAIADPNSSSQEAVGEADAIRRAFGRLKPDARVLIVLHHLEERPVAEIAGLLGVPEGTIKWRLHAARAALERALEAESR